jgi:lipid-binding SYLF domain-containing protein
MEKELASAGGECGSASVAVVVVLASQCAWGLSFARYGRATLH